MFHCAGDLWCWNVFILKLCNSFLCCCLWLFYIQDLNKLRRAALSFGFVEILDGLADVFDRECTLLPSSVHADCALQLTHAAERLRGPSAKDAKFTIPPMLTKYYTEVEIDWRIFISEFFLPFILVQQCFLECVQKILVLRAIVEKVK